MDYDWNLPESNREFERAIELNPNYATAHHWVKAIARERYAVQFVGGKQLDSHPVGSDELLRECDVALIPILFDKAAH